MLVDACHDAVHGHGEHAVALAGVVAVIVALHHLAQGVGHQGQLAALLHLLAVEVHIDLQAALSAHGRLGAVALDERSGQCLLEEGQSVDVARQWVVLHDVGVAALLPYHVAEEEAVAEHAAQGVGS